MSEVAETHTVFRGLIVHSKSRTEIEIVDGYLGVKEGKIDFLYPENGVPQHMVQAIESADVVNLDARNGKHKILMPGLIDTHTHAPQYPFRGVGYGTPLLEWLKKYTFPTEARFKEVKYAREVYPAVVKRLLRNGTTAVCYHASIHREATKELCKTVVAHGQRAFVGKVCMDRHGGEDYEESTEESIGETQKFVNEVVSDATLHGHRLVAPCVTPRFVPTCTKDLMQALGDIAKTHDIPIQSHISETIPECQWVKSLEGEDKSYTQVYHENGLLNSRTIMAHGIYLDETERKTFHRVGASVSHCPNSNYAIRSGIAQVRRLLDDGVNVGLGTDFAGGNSASILDAIRLCLIAADTINFQARDKGDEKNHSLSLDEAFYLATMGGAKAMKLNVGNFEIGKEFDALVVNPYVDNGPFDVFETNDEHDDKDFQRNVVEQFLFTGDDRNIEEVWIRGECVMREGVSSKVK